VLLLLECICSSHIRELNLPLCLLELSNMPIADLLQLKEQLGAKVYVSELTVCCDKQHF